MRSRVVLPEPLSSTSASIRVNAWTSLIQGASGASQQVRTVCFDAHPFEYLQVKVGHSAGLLKSHRWAVVARKYFFFLVLFSLFFFVIPAHRWMVPSSTRPHNPHSRILMMMSSLTLLCSDPPLFFFSSHHQTKRDAALRNVCSLHKRPFRLFASVRPIAFARR